MIVVIVIVIVVLLAAAALTAREMRRAKLRRQFGPEREQLTRELGSSRKADAALIAAQRRAAKVDILPLSSEQQAQYTADWTILQEQFVEAPANALVGARGLVAKVMGDRGYPDGDENDTIMSLSVHNAGALEDYRQAQSINNRSGEASTEELRAAMIRYRTLFDDLTDTSRPDGQVTPDRSTTDRSLASNGTTTADIPEKG
jgi:hypothetical protein